MRVQELFEARVVPDQPPFLYDEHKLDENLRKWFKDKWVRFGPDGKIRGDCARGSEGEGKPKCLPQKKAWALGKKKRATAARRKRRQDPHADREGAAKMVATKESVHLHEGVQETRDINLLALAAAKWISKAVKSGNLIINTKFIGIAKAAGIFEQLGPIMQNLLMLDEPEHWPLSLMVDNLAEQGSYASFNVQNNVITIRLKRVKANQIASALAHELQHAVDLELSQGSIFHNYVSGGKVNADTHARYLAHPSEVNARLAQVLIQLADLKLDRSNFVKELSLLLDKNHLSPRGQFPLDEKVYRRLMTRSYKFYTHSQQIKAATPWRMAWNKIVQAAKQLAQAITGEFTAESTQLDEKKDACYYKVKSRYKVWPSAYASGALVQCRKKGAKNWGNK